MRVSLTDIRFRVNLKTQKQNVLFHLKVCFVRPNRLGDSVPCSSRASEILRHLSSSRLSQLTLINDWEGKLVFVACAMDVELFVESPCTTFIATSLEKQTNDTPTTKSDARCRTEEKKQRENLKNVSHTEEERTQHYNSNFSLVSSAAWGHIYLDVSERTEQGDD